MTKLGPQSEARTRIRARPQPGRGGIKAAGHTTCVNKIPSVVTTVLQNVRRERGTMSLFGDFISWSRKERESLIHRTELMESGKLQTYEDRNEPEAVDTTAESIGRAKHQLAELDALLARNRRRRATDVLLSDGAKPSRTWREAWVEFVCGHCGAKSLRLVDTSEKIVKVECLSCGKESVVERAASSVRGI
jgi:predicted RNA-binding Zn-ribbon protein involved in translation (DUF1610 family)